MKISFIGKRRVDRVSPYPVKVMTVMPVPEGWGDKPKPSSARGKFRLTRGEIPFERLPVRLLPEKPAPPPPDIEDHVIGRLNEDNQRDILPEEVEMPRWARVDDETVSDELRDHIKTDEIRRKFIEQSKQLSFRIIVETIIVLFLCAIELWALFPKSLPAMFDPGRGDVPYLALHLLLAGFCILLNRDTLVTGYRKLFAKKPDGDTVLAVTSSVVFLHIAAQFIYHIFVRCPAVRVCGAPLSLALLINDIALLCMTLRSGRNFQFCALRSVRHAAMLVGRESQFDEMVMAGGHSRSNMVYSVRAKHLDGYLQYSSEQDFCEYMFSKISPYAMIAAVAAGVIGGLVTGSFWGGFYCLCAVMTIGVPVCRLFCFNVPLAGVSSKLLKKGAMLNGWAAIDEFGNADVLAVSSDTLFPKGSVKLLSVKAYGSLPVDSAVLYAAAVVTAAGGPLSQIFEELLERRADLLPQAEGIRYENEMGVSGWVDDKPVLVGNRRMLELHNCSIPSKDYEKLLGRSDSKRAVYISVSGRLAAVMLVEYRPPASAIIPVQRLVETGVSLVIYTCDSNVTAEQISAIYKIPKRLVSVLSTRAGSEYDQLTHTVRDGAPAVLATNGKLSSLAEGIRACVKLKSLLTFSAILQLACYIISLMIVVLLCVLSGDADSEPAKIIIMQVIFVLASLFPLAIRVVR